MKKIRIFSDFCDSQQCLENYYNVWQKKSVKFIFVADESYDYAIVINKAMPNLSIPKHCVLGLAFEPVEILCFDDVFIEYAQKHIGYYFVGYNNNLPVPFVSHYSFMWHIWLNVQPQYAYENKNRLMSIIVSNKQVFPGHIYRHKLCKAIVAAKLPIDIWGNGAYRYEYNCGEFTEREPYSSYKYTIAIENNTSLSYISEKFTNAIVENTIPIYYGANNISDYFGPNCYHRLVGDIERDISLLTKICQDPDAYKMNLCNAYYNLSEDKACLRMTLDKWVCT